MNIKAQLTYIGDVFSPTRTLTKRVIRVLATDQAPVVKLELELLNRNTSMIDGYKLGDHVVIHYRFRTTEGTQRMFTSLVVTKIENVVVKDVFGNTVR